MGCNPHSLENFWTHLRSSSAGREIFERHPHLQGHRDLRHTIPIITHIDAGPYSKRRSVKLFQWGPLLCRGCDYETRFVSFSWITKDPSRAHLPNLAWDEFRKSLDVLSRGVTEDGAPLAPVHHNPGTPNLTSNLLHDARLLPFIHCHLPSSHIVVTLLVVLIIVFFRRVGLRR